MEKIIPLTLISVIVLLTSFPAPVKAPGGGGGGFVGGGTPVGGGYMSGSSPTGGAPPAPNTGSGYMGAGSPIGNGYRGGGGSEPAIGTGYRGGAGFGKPIPGGDPGGVVIPAIPKPTEEPGKPPMPMPKECKPEVKDCIDKHVYGTSGPPRYRGECCNKLRKSVQCVCKFLESSDAKLRTGANDILRSCHYTRPTCGMPMPQECRPQVHHCLHVHMYGGAGPPPQGQACCEKFKGSKKCVCKFIKSRNTHLSNQAKAVLKGCQFTRTHCP